VPYSPVSISMCNPLSSPVLHVPLCILQLQYSTRTGTVDIYTKASFCVYVKSVPVIQVGPLGYFVNISITTPVVPALKKLLYTELSRISNGLSF
jgi:hypothetical protein